MIVAFEESQQKVKYDKMAITATPFSLSWYVPDWKNDESCDNDSNNADDEDGRH